tara:strand:+ start:3487 stop:4134 length:648 start_codon:yes stop_codon:yes gene_type:complete
MNLRIFKGKYIKRQIVKEFSSKYDDFDDALPIQEFYELHKEIISLMLQKTNLIFYNVAIVTGSKRAFFKIIGYFSDYIKDIIIWNKQHAQPAMKYNVLNRQTELIIVFDKNNAISRLFEHCNFERGTLSDCWDIKREKSLYKGNSATFPKKLTDHILKNFAQKNCVVFDPFMGTGTTGLSCYDYDCNFVGIERDIEAFQHAKDRIKSYRKQLRLF